MTTGDIKRSFCLGAVGQVGGLVGGFISVVIVRLYADDPVQTEMAIFLSQLAVSHQAGPLPVRFEPERANVAAGDVGLRVGIGDDQGRSAVDGRL